MCAYIVNTVLALAQWHTHTHTRYLGESFASLMCLVNARRGTICRFVSSVYNVHRALITASLFSSPNGVMDHVTRILLYTHKRIPRRRRHCSLSLWYIVHTHACVCVPLLLGRGARPKPRDFHCRYVITIEQLRRRRRSSIQESSSRIYLFWFLDGFLGRKTHVALSPSSQFD